MAAGGGPANGGLQSASAVLLRARARLPEALDAVAGITGGRGRAGQILHLAVDRAPGEPLFVADHRGGDAALLLQGPRVAGEKVLTLPDTLQGRGAWWDGRGGRIVLGQTVHGAGTAGRVAGARRPLSSQK